MTLGVAVGDGVAVGVGVALGLGVGVGVGVPPGVMRQLLVKDYGTKIVREGFKGTTDDMIALRSPLGSNRLPAAPSISFPKKQGTRELPREFPNLSL